MSAVVGVQRLEHGHRPLPRTYPCDGRRPRVEGTRGQCSRVQLGDRGAGADQRGVARGARGAYCATDGHGGEKGRVLYIGRRTKAEERAPLAVAAWHLPDCGPLELLELDVAQAVRAERPDLVGPCGASLLVLLRAIAAHAKLDRPGDRLAWITDEDRSPAVLMSSGDSWA